MSAFHFDPTAYGPAATALLAEPRLMSLGPGTPVAGVRAAIEQCDVPAACRAGLFLYFDHLDASHAISQDDESDPDRNFWHAVMHRREPDAENSKYWWRRVGPHPVLQRLVEQAPAVGYTYTNPFDFVGFCERARDTGTLEEDTAKWVQLLEWQLLFDYCYRQANS